MLKRLHLKNFTVFADADFEFGPGLNVLVGTNGTGKSHVLKLGYAVTSTIVQGIKQNSMMILNEETLLPILSPLSRRLTDIFQPVPSQIKELISRSERELVATIIVELSSGNINVNAVINIANTHPKSRALVKSIGVENEEINSEPVFIPAKEILTLGWMRPASKQLRLPLDETYLDLLNQLDRLPLKQPIAATVLEKLTEVIGGEVESDGSRFYVSFATQKPMDVSMVAEGLRKFGTLQRLISNGSLTSQATLFWDEPEANLNPALLQKLAAILAELARQGFQIILATHSTDLLKEFHILSRRKDAEPLPIKYFGLNARPGEATTVVTTDNFEYLPDVVALEVELEQADNLDEIFAREDRERHANL